MVAAFFFLDELIRQLHTANPSLFVKISTELQAALAEAHQNQRSQYHRN
jgi:hypothetical protein